MRALSVRALAVVFLVLCLVGAAAADNLVKVFVNGKAHQFSPAARERGGVAYAPLRAACEAVGAEVKWDAPGRRAIVCAKDRCMDIAESDGITVDGRLLIPLRLLAKAIGAEVAWDNRAAAVRIRTR
jgi:hypothetical protein